LLEEQEVLTPSPTQLSADEVIGKILDANNVFIPIAVGPFGELGSLFRRFIESHRILPLPDFSADRPNATRAF
jgi:hypothetical protein